jgi:hypothetical protein
MKITLGLNHQVKAAVTGETVKHMVKEAYAGRDLSLAGPIQIDLDANSGLFRFPKDLCGSWCAHGDGSY